MAVSEEKWVKWKDSWNGMKKEEFQTYVDQDDEARLVKIAPEELRIKMAQKYTRFFGVPFPIALGDVAPEESKDVPPDPDMEAEEKPKASAGLPQTSTEDQAAIDAINQKRKETLVDEEVARQADLLDAADLQTVQKKVILTEQQQFIASLVDAAEAQAPKISVTELSQRLMMLIPDVIKKAYPAYSYKWASVDNLQAELHTFGGMWEVVARVNHGKIPAKLFGPEGSVMYKGASILVFTRRQTTEYLDKQTIQELDLRVRESTQNMTKTYRDPRGREQVHLEIIDKEPPGKIGTLPLKEETIGPQPDGSQGDYDFGDTGTDGEM